MIFKLFAAITFALSRALEALFDLLEYRIAKRAFQRAAKAKVKRKTRVHVAEVIASRAVRQPTLKST